jgi:uracil-DNA glycosylase
MRCLGKLSSFIFETWKIELRLEKLIGQEMSGSTVAVWYPPKGRANFVNKGWLTETPVNPKYPVYVISKGRWESRLTSRALERMQVPYHIVIEPQEYERYAEHIDEDKILVLPFSNLGQGSIPARNWVWEHAIETGAAWHWILDDNIRKFYRIWNNSKIPVYSGVIFRLIEEFVDRYENIGQAGMNYSMFFPRREKMPPLYLNTRIYSCILNRNDVEYRWRGRYNEDTDLSLRILKDGWATVLFHAFNCDKTATMRMRGGNTDQLYKQDTAFDGRYEMAKSLQEQHPDCVKIGERWGRWQHQVDYSRFKKTRLKLKKIARIPKTDNNFGMYLGTVDRGDDECIWIIGQAPSQNGDAGDPCAGKIGKRIAKLAGISFDDYIERTQRMNVFDEWPGKKGKGDAWDAKQAKERVEEMWNEIAGGRVIFLGKNVANAFGHGEVEWCEWKIDIDTGMQIAVLPHPSGVNHWWNERANRKRAGKFLRQAFEIRELNESTRARRNRSEG